MSKISLAGTHLPILSKLLRTTTGSVLELGAGWNSTPLLYWTCQAEKRHFESWENDEKWVKQMEGLTNYAYDWEITHMNPTGDKWSIVFIDCRPALMRRKLALKYKDMADFIVLHDSEPEIDRFYGYSKIYKQFEFVYNFDKLKPNTVVLSNVFPPRFFL